MSKISLGTLIASALWIRQSETGRGYLSVSELEHYAKNVLEKIEEKKAEENIENKYNIKFSLKAIRNTTRTSSCFFYENNKIYINKANENWKVGIINLKNHYKDDGIVDYALNNSDIPFLEVPLLNVYNADNYEQVFEEIDKQIKNVHKEINDMKDNPEPVLKKYLDLYEQLKKLKEDKFKAKIDFFNNCNHPLFYSDIDNRRNKECKCLSCEKILSIDSVDSRLCVPTTNSFKKVKELYLVISELTDKTEVIRNVIINDLEQRWHKKTSIKLVFYC